jgi:hypothetical protein
MTHVNALAGGTRPTAITGFAPTYHWLMVLTSSQELNISTGTVASGFSRNLADHSLPTRRCYGT